jgi:hypothetical protein
MEKPRVLDEVQSAKNAVADAAGDLTRLLAEIHAMSRAEKTTISNALRDAVRKLDAARQHLVTLEKLTRAKSVDKEHGRGGGR